MDKKKYKILMIVDIVLIVGLFALMMVLKGNYNDQAQKSVNEQISAYLDLSNGAMQEQWLSVDQYGMAWRLVYASLTGAKTETAFDSAASAIESDKDARFKQISYMYASAGIPLKAQKTIHERAGLADKFTLSNAAGVKEFACGKNCSIKFTFAKGKLKSFDYKALLDYNMVETFKLSKPATFRFE